MKFKFEPKWTVGIIALGFVNLIALIYDSQWLTVAIGADMAVVGAYLGVGLQAKGTS